MRLECRLSAEGRNSRQSTVLFPQPAALFGEAAKAFMMRPSMLQAGEERTCRQGAKRLGLTED